MTSGNLLHGIPEHLPEELAEVLLTAASARVERIVSRGHASPDGFWYDQDTAEWVTVVQGAARLEFDDGKIREMAVGDWIDIPAHRRHRVAWTLPDADTVWLAVHYEPPSS